MSKQLEKFLRKKKRGRNNAINYQDVFDGEQPELLSYANTGVVSTGEKLPDDDYNGFPPLPWETVYVHNPLRISGMYYEAQFEQQLIVEQMVDAPLLGRAFSYFYYSLAIQFQGVKLYPTRFGRENEGAIGSDRIFNLASATLLGLEQQADHLFNLAVHCTPRHSINALYSYFNDFIILLMARARNHDLVFSRGRSDLIFPYQDIIDSWDSEDETVIKAALLHLCDEQMKQVASPPSADYFEFDNINWQFYPYAALMLMKLRLNKGLTNPIVEHPAFGQLNNLLPDELTKLPVDDTLTAVVKRMKQQGFDENEVFCLTNLP